MFEDVSNEDNRTKVIEENKGHNGFIAQEVKDVIPSIVKQNEESGKLEISTIEIIPYLVEAIKEQQAQIESLEAKIAEQDENYYTKSSLTTEDDSNHLTNSVNCLNQNKPNPFTEETSISYYLSDNVVSAILYIYDLSGRQIKSYKTMERGNAEILVEPGTLDKGMYIYTLVADGKIIGSKQMILTD